MGEMRRGARCRRGFCVRHKSDHSATSWHSTRSTVAFSLENRFPLFRESALTMGRKVAMPTPAGDRWMELTEEDVLEILKLFEQSKFDFLQLEQGERKITVSKCGYVPTAAGGTRAMASSSSSTAAAAISTQAPALAP